MGRPLSASVVLAVCAAVGCATQSSSSAASSSAPSSSAASSSLSYVVTDVQLPMALATYAGELWAPTAAVEGRPLVVMLAGSGNNDRDGNQKPVVQAKPLRLIAEALASAGIGSLRVDKIGSGATRAHFKDESELTFDHIVEVTREMVAYAIADGRFDTIVVLGHSEGALAALVVGNDADVDGVVTVAGPGRNLANVLLEQLARSFNEADLAESRRVVESLRAGTLVPSSSIALPEQMRAVLFRDSVQPYLRSLMQRDPAAIAATLTRPLLVIQGDHDIQVSVADAELLAQAKGIKATVVPGVNHVLKAAPLTRDENIAAYADPTLPVPTAVTASIVAFVRDVAARP